MGLSASRKIWSLRGGSGLGGKSSSRTAASPIRTNTAQPIAVAIAFFATRRMTGSWLDSRLVMSHSKRRIHVSLKGYRTIEIRKGADNTLPQSLATEKSYANRWRPLRWVLVLSLASIGFGPFACGPMSHEQAREPFDTSTHPSEPARTPPATNESGAAPGPPNLIANGSFENRDETGRPRGWAVSPSSILTAAGSPIVYPYDGSEYLLLKSTDESYGVVAFTLPLDSKDLGKTVVVTAQGRSPLGRYMFLAIRYTVDGEYVERLHEWPACPNAWTENIARETIPLEADPASVQVRILIRNEGGYTFCLDHVRAFVLDGPGD